MAQTTPAVAPPPGWRFQVGVGVFVFGWSLPIFIPLVAASDLSIEWKAMISGVLAIGGPEILSLVSIAFLGKAGFNYIKARLFALFKRAAPPDQVSRMRYRFGLLIWLLLFVFGYFILYAPDVIPGYDEHRIAINLVCDALFIASFFILGGDFWDKFRALFIYEAKAVIPAEQSTGDAAAAGT